MAYPQARTSSKIGKLAKKEIFKANFPIRSAQIEEELKLLTPIPASKHLLENAFLWDWNWELDIDDFDDEEDVINQTIEINDQPLQDSNLCAEITQNCTNSEITSTDHILNIFEQETNAELIARIRIIWVEVDKGNYCEETQQRFLDIAQELIRRGCSIIPSKCTKFSKEHCDKFPGKSRFMLDLQRLDLYLIWYFHNGHEADNEALDYLFVNIFEDDEFDWDQAHSIAVAEYEDITKVIKNLTVEQKIIYLSLPDIWQEKLTVLRSNKVRKAIDRKNKKQREENKKRKAIQVQAIDVCAKLEKHIQYNPPKNKCSMDLQDCTQIWIAIQSTGSNLSNLAGIISAYENSTGKSLSKSILQRRISLMKRASVLR